MVVVLYQVRSQSWYIFTDSDSDSTQNSFRLQLHSPAAWWQFLQAAVQALNLTTLQLLIEYEENIPLKCISQVWWFYISCAGYLPIAGTSRRVTDIVVLCTYGTVFMKMKVCSVCSGFRMNAKLCCWGMSEALEMVLWFPVTEWGDCIPASQQGSYCAISGCYIIGASFVKDELDGRVIVNQQWYRQQIIEIWDNFILLELCHWRRAVPARWLYQRC
jgi:hypothetical protein